jgi:hypothetical protein
MPNLTSELHLCLADIFVVPRRFGKGRNRGEGLLTIVEDGEEGPVKELRDASDKYVPKTRQKAVIVDLLEHSEWPDHLHHTVSPSTV